MAPLMIHAAWDRVACVWVAESSDVPGLATEAKTVEALVERLAAMIPDLLSANRVKPTPDVSFVLLARRLEPLHVPDHQVSDRGA
ncbi:DUF1902 domain-containing protein [Chiayiivirga flava]|uniref:Putative RNase H-like HicB family nuclease n=1 Tax=Chiayiivirga flava TaxID=659595 RepID=A0A7W8D597_9GAMM|nr:DUF1902 domain-containing protein [Chiayiivirga flava]MBB5208169.1 putative RNase H-like HicB family nuclease [Chiayiivirga flava]